MSENARFCQNNLAAADAATLTESSQLTDFEVENAIDQKRYKKWVTTGRFKITASNRVIYINDGSDKTVNLTIGEYTTAVLMAAHIQTQLNASSTNWTCSHSGANGKFNIGRSSGTAILRLTQTTNAAWSTLGYTGVADFDAGTGTNANARRNHTSESVVFDLGSAQEVTAFIAIGAADADFGIPSTATVTLKGNSVNSFSAAPFSTTITPEASGIFSFIGDLGVSTTYRYWEFEFTDLTNPDGPQYSIHQIYLGDYISPINRNISNGFEPRLIDESVINFSESGVPFFRRINKYWTFSSINFEFLADSDRTELMRAFSELGTTTPFFFSADPDGTVSGSIGEFTKYVVFAEPPNLSHTRFKYYQYGVALREVV